MKDNFWEIKETSSPANKKNGLGKYLQEESNIRSS